MGSTLLPAASLQCEGPCLCPSIGAKMKILLWILAIIFLIGLLVVFGVFSLIF